MGKQTYAEKLRDPRWQKKRLEVFERDEWTCRGCGECDKTLNVHHRYYLSGIEPWEYEIESLITYCNECHESEFIGGLRKEIVRRCGMVPPSCEWNLQYILLCLCNDYFPLQYRERVLKEADAAFREFGTFKDIVAVPHG